MPENLTVGEVKKLCGERTYQRGLHYQRGERVTVAEWDEFSRAIFGEVEGSGKNIYEQEIYFSPAGRNRLNGFCSCPVSRNCKHVAAVLLEWIDRNQASSENPVSPLKGDLGKWLKSTNELLSLKNNDQGPEPGNKCLLYLLDEKNRGFEHKVTLRAVKSRRLKRGGWGKANNFNLFDLNSYYSYYGSAAGALPLDYEVARLLADDNAYSNHLPQIKGDFGLLALQRLLQSGRCFYRSLDNPPLSLGPPRTASFHWKTEKEKTQLEILLEGESSGWLLIPTATPWYLDTQSHQCGPISQPLSTVMLQALRALPEIASDQLTELSYFLLRELPPQSIELPVELVVNQIDQPPIPHLFLHSVKDSQGNRHHLARICFDYGPLTLPPYLLRGQELELIRSTEEDWQVRRYPTEEASALQSLSDLGLEPASPSLERKGELELFFERDSLAASALAWRNLVAELPRLEGFGWKVTIDDTFVISFETISEIYADIDDENSQDWFEIGLTIEHDGHKISLAPLLVQWFEEDAHDQPLLHRLEGNRWLEIPHSVLQPVVETLVELFSDHQGDVDAAFRLLRSRSHSLLDIEERLNDSGHQIHWKGGKNVRQLAEKLRNFSGVTLIDKPDGLTGELRGYQQQGLSWLQFLREYEFNGILADDMGLGKTLQTLSHLLIEKNSGRLDRPALIVAPTSVLSNWLREAERFTPGLNCLLLHGPERAEEFSQLASYDLVITSYALLTRDLEQHLQQSYHSLILDEAQAIKNPQAKTTQAALQIKAAHRLCLTGTPLENHLGELWSLFHFLMPGFLGKRRDFTQIFRTPIEKHQNKARQEQLQQRISPFILRRTKEKVALELPPKTMMIREAELGSAQAKLYESLRLSMTKKITGLLKSKGLQRSHIEILDALLKLCQACCDPRLVKLDSARKVKPSAKLETLLELLEKLRDEGRKIIVFSQFTSMLALIEVELEQRKINYSKLTGQTRKRDAAITAFQEGDAQVFLISLKAGGVGLNLTAADTVIHYDPWWNPAVEKQATDRAHRIGQEKPVFVYKLVAKGTVEEKILQLQEKKQKLADGVYARRAQDEPLSGISSEDILNLLTPIKT
ncbi:MAG: helicase SNF2 [Desulfuromonas sp.]|nr:MAG: helicase SNF2 [Desulfuromonas sp.]